MKKVKAIQFLGYIPPLQSAITFGDDTPRVKIDIDPACQDQAKGLIDMKGMALKFTVEVVE